MKKILYSILKIFTIVTTVFVATFLMCKYWNYMEGRREYFKIYSDHDGYGYMDNGEIIDGSDMLYFEGVYIRTSYNSIDEVIDNEKVVVISLNCPFQVDRLYVVYPEMRVFGIYKESVFEKESYDNHLLNFLMRLQQRIQMKNMEQNWFYLQGANSNTHSFCMAGKFYSHAKRNVF